MGNLKMVDKYVYQCELCGNRQSNYNCDIEIIYPDNTSKYVCKNCLSKEIESDNNYYRNHVPDFFEGGLISHRIFNNEDETFKFINTLDLIEEEWILCYDKFKDNVYLAMEINKEGNHWLVKGYTNVNLEKYGVPNWKTLRKEK